MLTNPAQNYWLKVKKLQDSAHEDTVSGERRYRETGDRADLAGQEENASAPDGGLYLMSLENDERCTVGGRICSGGWLHQAIGRMLANRTHRIATAAEIADFRRKQDEKRAQNEALQERLERRSAVTIRPLAPIGKGQ